MPINFPIILDAREKLTKSGGSSSGGTLPGLHDQNLQRSSTPILKITPIAVAGQECQEKRLLTIANWPETKTETELSCWDVPIIGRVCTNLPRVYKRDCEKYIYVTICYPTGTWDDVNDCVIGAAVTGTIAGILVNPETGCGAFVAALQACLTLKGKEWADRVTASAGYGSSCGAWHPV